MCLDLPLSHSLSSLLLCPLSPSLLFLPLPPSSLPPLSLSLPTLSLPTLPPLQIIVDIIGMKPRLDTKTKYFTQTFQQERDCLAAQYDAVQPILKQVNPL